MTIFGKIRRFFYLTSKDLGMQQGSPEEISQIMNSTDKISEDKLPIEFAKTMKTIFQD